MSEWPLSTLLSDSGKIVAMAKPAKRKYRVTTIRAWREEKDLTLEYLAPKVGMTASNLSKIERGELPYSQELLEGLAEEYDCEPADILRAPGKVDPLASELSGLSSGDRQRALLIIRALRAAPKAA